MNILEKCKVEKTEAFQQIRQMGNVFFEYLTNIYTISYLFDTFITIISHIKIILVHKYIP